MARGQEIAWRGGIEGEGLTGCARQLAVNVSRTFGGRPVSLSDGDIARRRAAKRFNERVKLLATFLNNSSIATFVGGYVLPYLSASSPAALGWSNPLWVLVYVVVLHGLGQLTLTLYRSED